MYIARKVSFMYRKVIRSTDKRVNLTSEMIQGILAIKAFCWEDSIENAIQDSRNKENAFLVKLNAIGSVSNTLAVSMATVTTFVTFTYLWAQGKSFNLPDTFYALSLLSLLRLSLFSGLSSGTLIINYIIKYI